MLDSLRLVAPGTPLREGLDRILQARMGAMIVVGDGPEVLHVCSGGFLLDAEFTPQRLSELAKMDGAIILASDSSRVARANVHLVPDPNIPTSETGTRHRTAERVGRQIDVPVITVSEDMSVVAVHRRGLKRTLDPIPRVLASADRAVQILERYKARLDAVSNSLSALEVEDLVTVRDVATVLQRAEMVRRIAEEIEGYVIELGADGRLVLLQLEEAMGGVEDDRRLVAKDYFVDGPDWGLVDVMVKLADLDTESLLDLREVASLLHLPADVSLDAPIQPRGFRLLHKIPRIPEVVADHVVERFSNLQKIMRAGVSDLVEDLCRRLATHGFAVVCAEPFARFPREVREASDATVRMAHMKEMDDDAQLGDLAAAAAFLTTGDGADRVSIIGFCMGGMYTLKAAATGTFARAVAFYGMIRVPDDWRSPGQRDALATAAQVCPTLAIFGGKDPWTPPDDIDALRAAWRDRDDCEIVVYPEADHGFVHGPERPAHRPDDAADAWQRTLDFLRR